MKEKIDGVPIEEDRLEASLLFIILFITIVFVTTIVLSLMGLDIMTSFSASAATMGNVGPGFGSVGSISSYSQIPDLGKWILTGNMLLGRLEIYGIILLFRLRWWK